ncbi:MAG: acetate--CoA ligase family protein [Phycisphaerales bacterium]
MTTSKTVGPGAAPVAHQADGESGRTGLDAAFAPRTVVVIGATDRAGSVGGAVMANLVAGPPQRTIFAVNPGRESVMGCRCFRDVADVPRPVDLAVVCTRAESVPEIVAQCAAAGVGAALVISAGFRESGPAGAALEGRLASCRVAPGRAARAASNDAPRTAPPAASAMRIIGPNCLGILVPGTGLSASFAQGMPPAGSVAFISQSGALCTAMLDWAIDERIGFSRFVSTGNMVDVDFADLIDHAAADPATGSIVLYIESIRDGVRFIDAAQRCPKPIIAYKAGRSPESARAASTHTGAMAGEDAVYDAALRKAGIVRVGDIGEIRGAIELLGAPRRPRGDRLAIVTNAGGPGVVATDALMERRGTLATLGAETIEGLSRVLPPHWSHGNPVDIIGDSPARRFGDATRLVLADDAVDAMLVILTPQKTVDASQAAREVVAAAEAAEACDGAGAPSAAPAGESELSRPRSSAPVSEGTDARLARRTGDGPKLVMAAWMGGAAVREGVRVLHQARLPVFGTPEEAVRAFVHVSRALAAAAAHKIKAARDARVHVPRTSHDAAADDARRAEPSAERPKRVETLTEPASKALLAACGIDVAPTVLARTRSEAIAAAAKVPGPVAMKIVSPGITHKSDVAGVALRLRGDAEVGAAYDRIVESARRLRPDAAIEGVCVQPMVSDPDGVELIVGAKRDPTFGPVVMVGAGGVMAELLADRAVLIPPLDDDEAVAPLRSLRLWPLLQGFRGRPALDVRALIDVLGRIAALPSTMDGIVEVEANPLLLTRRGAVALDARVIVGATDSCAPRGIRPTGP